jgi:hypothetical protein
MGSGGGPTGGLSAKLERDLTLSYKNMIVSVLADLLEVLVETESGIVMHQFSMVNGLSVAKPTEPPSDEPKS